MKKESSIVKKTKNLSKNIGSIIPESIFYAALEATANGVVITNKKGEIEWVNGAFTELTGYTFLEAIGKNPKILKSWEQSDDVYKNLWSTISAGKVWYGEIVNKRKDGKLYIEEMTISPVVEDEGKVTHFIAIKQDITSRRLAEEKLRESEERLNFAMNTSHTGVWDLNLLDHTAFRSLEHDRIFGYPKLLPEWTYEMFLDHVLQEDREEVSSRFNYAINNKSDWSFECRIRRVDGEIRWIWATGRHHINKAGALQSMLGIVQDITEQKKAEQETLKTEFIADATHELRTPLAIIRGNIDLLARSGLSSSGQNEKINAINGEIEHLTELLSDLTLLASKGNEAYGKINLEKINLNLFLEKIVKRCEILASKKNISINFKKSPDFSFCGDKVYLEKLFLNIIKNAITYGREKGKVTISSILENRFFHIDVADNGIGIKQEEITFIFDRFYRTKEAKSNKHKGSGLGLSISKWVSEAHGGEIKVLESSPKGTTFRISLPLGEI